MNYSRIAQLGRQAAMEKMALNRTVMKALTPKVKPYVPKSPLTSKPGTLRPELKNIADKLGIPEDEYLNIMRGHLQHSPLPGAQRAGLNATPKQIRSALGGAAATAGGLGIAGMAGKELADPHPQKFDDTLNTLTPGGREAIKRREPNWLQKALPHQATPVPN